MVHMWQQLEPKHTGFLLAVVFNLGGPVPYLLGPDDNIKSESCELSASPLRLKWTSQPLFRSKGNCIRL